MDIIKAITALREEREPIDEAILTLERFARGGRERRGRPPWLAALAAKRPGRPPGRKGMSAAARKAHSARMKKYWAERRRKG